MKKNGVFHFCHISSRSRDIQDFCKLGTDDVIRCDNMEVKHKIDISASNDAKQLEFGKYVVH